MNAVLQAFTHILPLHRGLLLLDLKLHSSCPRADENKFCILCALRNHLTEAGHPSRDTVNPSELYNGLQSFMPEYTTGKHQDPHEFMIKALTALKGCLLEYNNLIDLTFRGAVVKQLRCCSCKASDEPVHLEVFDLTLNIDNASDTQTALDIYFNISKIDGAACSFCNKVGFCEEKRWLLEAPSVVVIHLNRLVFEFDPHSRKGHTRKENKNVGFKMDIDLEPYALSPTEKEGYWKYDLYAIVEHVGASVNSGHYICYVRCVGDQWYSMSDTVVTKVSEEAVMSKEAYLLFYLRKGTPWFSSQEVQATASKKRLNMSIIDIN
ncbi:putative ubiquitinyl hydrolase 1 [Medicago truncatula]|uniref:Putative ubiquitinyl hydrolase 1 n=1 Tax=Medicago truncatula TaxID=3880 RepID=A0A396IHP2_MEDTR|nr:ubiquitin carboxyl-terminal hydrolase 20 [Medicago truncatula]RHN63824.1 putative ubiquitinyl hydrolase 1 [Medicago truncatula]